MELHCANRLGKSLATAQEFDMRRWILFALPIAVVVMNYGAVVDVFAIRPSMAAARQILPQGWEGLAAHRPEVLFAAQTQEQRRAMAEAHAVFVTSENGAVLTIPRGLDDDQFELRSRCFRHVRRDFMLIVWPIRTSIGCL